MNVWLARPCRVGEKVTEGKDIKAKAEFFDLQEWRESRFW
jgi:hypothetical protein